MLRRRENFSNPPLPLLFLSSFPPSDSVSVENLNGGFIQLSAMLTSTDEIGTMKVISFLVSSFMVAVAVNELDLRKDTNLYNRTVRKAFYGLIPESGLRKIWATTAMKAMSFSQFNTRVGLCVLLGIKSGTLLLALLAVEFGLFMVYKAAKGDWRYW